MKRYISFPLGLVVGLLLALPAAAQLNGHNLRGDYGLSAGSQPPPGLWLGAIYVNLDIDSLRDRNGDQLELPIDLDYQAIAPWVWWVSEKKLLGGNYSFFVAPSWANGVFEAPSLGVTSKTSYGFGDLYVQPIVLGWHRERADYLAGLGVYAPTGRYEVGADDNIGLGMWSFEAFGGATFYLDQAKTWNLATVAFYETHTTKDGTNQKVGDILTVEGGLGKSFVEGAINVGLVYFAQWKVSDDDLGLEVGPLGEDLLGGRHLNQHQIYGVGPEVTLPLASKKKFYGSLTVRYFWDFGVKSNAESQTLLVNVSMPIPSISLTGG